MSSYVTLFLQSVFTENLVLALFLGICPFMALSRRFDTAVGLGAAVVVVMTVTVPVNSLILGYLLGPGALAWAGLPAMDLSFLALVSFIGVIAAIVQVLEMVLDRFFPALHQALGVFLPLNGDTAWMKVGSTVSVAALVGRWPSLCWPGCVTSCVTATSPTACRAPVSPLSLPVSWPWVSWRSQASGYERRRVPCLSSVSLSRCLPPS